MTEGRAFRWYQMLAYGALSMPLAMVGLALVMFVPTFYATSAGLGLGAVGAVFAIGRLLDVATDPLVGHLSDRTQSRFGPRLPWIVLSAPVFVLSVWFLLRPPEGASLMYLIGISTVFYIAYTAFDVPYSAIGLEVSPHTHERSLLAAYRAVPAVIGGILAAALPEILGAGLPETLRTLTLIFSVMIAVGLVALLSGMPLPRHTAPVVPVRPIEAMRRAMAHRAFVWLLAAFFVVQAANALMAGLTVLYVSHVLGAPHLVGAFSGLLFLSSAVLLPLWVVLSRKIGKVRTWATTIVIATLALLALAVLGQTSVALAALCFVLLGGALGTDAVMPTSILADIVRGREEAGETRLGATLLGLKNSASKLTFVLPTGIAFPVLGLVGFNQTGANEQGALFWLVLFFAGLPAVLRVLAFVLVTRGLARHT